MSPTDLSAMKDRIERLTSAIRAVQEMEPAPLEVDIVPAVFDEDGDETESEYRRLKCPWCFGIIDPGEDNLTYVEFARNERSLTTDGEESVWVGEDPGGETDLLYVSHDTCGNPVSLPDGWSIEWM